jgi:hypothetical protein
VEDQFARQYEELLDGCYDCVDRIVLNAYVPNVETVVDSEFGSDQFSAPTTGWITLI